MGEAKSQDWRAIGGALATLLAERRHAWFAEVLRVLAETGQPLQKRELTDMAQLAVLAYQLLSVSVAMSEYVAVSDGPTASGEIYDQVAGEHAGVVVMLVQRYLRLDLPQRRTQFLLDVLKDLLGQEPDLIPLLTLDVSAATLDVETRAATMAVFGDEARSRETLQKFYHALEQQREKGS